MKQSIKKYSLVILTFYLLGLLFIAYAYQKDSIDVAVMQYYIYAGGLFGLIGYRFFLLHSDKTQLEHYIRRQAGILTVQSASGFINYSKTDIPISQIGILTVAQGYLLVELKTARPGDKKLEFFFPATKQEIQSRLFTLFQANELNKIQFNMLAD